MITEAYEQYEKAMAEGIRPATGIRAECMRRMSKTASDLIKAIDLELSGIRDGDGHWNGIDPMDIALNDLVYMVEAYKHIPWFEELAAAPAAVD